MINKKLIPISIFCLISTTCGWLGRLVDLQSGQSGTQTLGTLIWLLSPYVMAIGFILTQKNKFSAPNLPLNQNYNIFTSLLFYPFLIGITLIFATLFGGYSIQNNVFRIEIFVGIIISALIKNLFEEFGWRGYLTPKLHQLGFSNSYNHLITGITWGLWHLPYFLMLNPTLVLQSTTDYIVYSVQFLVSVIAVSWIYGEFRLRTGNIWFGYILHVIVNIITATLVTFNLLKIGFNSFIFGPFDGLVYSTIAICLTYFWQKHNFKLIQN